MGAMNRRSWCLSMVLCALLAACDDPPAESAAELVQQRLAGTWLREYEEQGTRVRRILVLEPGGHFRENSTLVAPGAAARQDASGEGEWSFDGTNLKRRYTYINGRPASHPFMPYATFELSFPSRLEFIGVDHVRQREVHYRRVADGTKP